MTQEHYVERVLSSLSLQPQEDLQARLNHLNHILELIENVPSPEKESLLVELILNPWQRPEETEGAHSSL